MIKAMIILLGLQEVFKTGTKFEYDNTDNLYEHKLNGSIARNSLFNNNNEIISSNGIPYSYDPKGNLLNDGLHNLAWSGNNRLISIDGEGVVYDAANYRVKMGDREYYSANQKVVLKKKAGVTTTRYVPGISVFSEKNGQREFYLFNSHGDVVTRVDEQGNIVQSYSYSPYGEAIGVDKDDFEYGYVGNQGVMADRENGLLYMKNRWYSPVTFRFLSEDPIGLRGGKNLFSYAKNNPVNLVDPEGLVVGSIPGFVVGATSAAISTAGSGGSNKQILFAGLAGGAAGALLGSGDPTLGVGTAFLIAFNTSLVTNVIFDPLGGASNVAKASTIGFASSLGLGVGSYFGAGSLTGTLVGGFLEFETVLLFGGGLDFALSNQSLSDKLSILDIEEVFGDLDDFDPF